MTKKQETKTMNEVVETIERFIQKKTGRFSNLDQVEIYNEIINYLDDQVRMSMMQEYNLDSCSDED